MSMAMKLIARAHLCIIQTDYVCCIFCYTVTQHSRARPLSHHRLGVIVLIRPIENRKARSFVVSGGAGGAWSGDTVYFETRYAILPRSPCTILGWRHRANCSPLTTQACPFTFLQRVRNSGSSDRSSNPKDRVSSRESFMVYAWIPRQ